MALLAKCAIREQFKAIMRMRWWTLVNSLRTRQGKFELGASLLQGGILLVIWLGIGLSLGFAAWESATRGELSSLSILFGSVLVAWQIIPFALASFQENVDLSFLVRFPVSFSVYTALYIFFGLFDFSSLTGGVALLGIWIGIGVARPDLAVWAALALALFAAFNLLLARMIFSWVNRWLAQRKTREILGILLLFSFLGLQFLNPAFHQRAGNTSSTHPFGDIQMRTVERLQEPFPPALAADSIEKANEGEWWRALVPLGWMVLYTAGVGMLLSFRLRTEFSGEQLSDGTKKRKHRLGRRADAHFSWLPTSGSIGAVVEKEIHYLFRSGAILYGLAAPPVLVFLSGGVSEGRQGHIFEYALPLGIAYGFLGLTRLIGNSLGGEATGIQLYFLAPTSFRTIMLGKNLFQIGVLCVELAVVCAIVWIRFGMPGPLLIAATFCWLLFALSVQLALGNVLSIKMAYRMTLTRMSRERGSLSNALISLLIQIAVVAIGAGIFFYLSRLSHAEWAAPVFLLFAVCGTIGWLRGLSRLDRMANERRELLMDSLIRS